MTAPDTLKQWHIDFVQWFRDMELPMSDRAGLLFDRLDALERQETELLNIIPTVKRRYGEVGSRDTDIAAWNTMVDLAIAKVRGEQAAAKATCRGERQGPCGYCGNGPCPLPI